MSSMKAIRIHEYGSTDVLHYEDAPRPTAALGEVLVRVSAVGVNPIDWKVRAGYLKDFLPVNFPWVPGLDFSGTIEALGSDVTSFTVGDDVFGKVDLPQGGGYAEFVVVPTTSIVRKPKGIDHAFAAAIPGAAVTAWQALFDDGAAELQAGQTVLILGAAGGVGGFAIQLAKWKGARVVAAGRTANKAYVHSLGADVFVDTSKGDLSSAGEVDAVLDLVGGDLQESAWPQLKQGGVFVSSLSVPSDDKASPRGARTALIYTYISAQQLEFIADLVEKGVVKVEITKALPLEQAQQAHQYLEGHGVVGKLVLLT